MKLSANFRDYERRQDTQRLRQLNPESRTNRRESGHRGAPPAEGPRLFDGGRARPSVLFWILCAVNPGCDGRPDGAL